MEPENIPRQSIDPNHDRKRFRLRRYGLIVMVCALILVLVGFSSFVSSFGTGQPPHYFWCMFIGLPMLFAALVLLQAGFAGAVARYLAGESAPVAKDSFNYMARDTKDGVKTIAAAIGEGIATGRTSVSPVACQKCNEPNDPDARFCNQCGAPMAGATTCPACKKSNAPGARFCDSCGRALAA